MKLSVFICSFLALSAGAIALAEGKNFPAYVILGQTQVTRFSSDRTRPTGPFAPLNPCAAPKDKDAIFDDAKRACPSLATEQAAQANVRSRLTDQALELIQRGFVQGCYWAPHHLARLKAQLCNAENTAAQKLATGDAKIAETGGLDAKSAYEASRIATLESAAHYQALERSYRRAVAAFESSILERTIEGKLAIRALSQLLGRPAFNPRQPALFNFIRQADNEIMGVVANQLDPGAAQLLARADQLRSESERLEKHAAALCRSAAGLMTPGGPTERSESETDPCVIEVSEIRSRIARNVPEYTASKDAYIDDPRAPISARGVPHGQNAGAFDRDDGGFRDFMNNPRDVNASVRAAAAKTVVGGAQGTSYLLELEDGRKVWVTADHVIEDRDRSAGTNVRLYPEVTRENWGKDPLETCGWLGASCPSMYLDAAIPPMQTPGDPMNRGADFATFSANGPLMTGNDNIQALKLRSTPLEENEEVYISGYPGEAPDSFVTIKCIYRGRDIGEGDLALECDNSIYSIRGMSGGMATDSRGRVVGLNKAEVFPILQQPGDTRRVALVQPVFQHMNSGTTGDVVTYDLRSYPQAPAPGQGPPPAFNCYGGTAEGFADRTNSGRCMYSYDRFGRPKFHFLGFTTGR